MHKRIITGFHAIEERLKSENANCNSMQIVYSKIGPRAKQIISFAKKIGVNCSASDEKYLNTLVANLSDTARDHRGIVLCVSEEDGSSKNIIEFDEWISKYSSGNIEEKASVLILDSITDPHNVGAILRSSDQFGISLVILPQNRSANDILHNEIIARSSAGASSWVDVSIVSNLVRVVQKLKDAGFWIYGADTGGETLSSVDFAKKSAIIMGSEGSGISQLLEKQCDKIISIPTCGKIDSLNVSVAAGILLYELSRRK